MNALDVAQVCFGRSSTVLASDQRRALIEGVTLLLVRVHRRVPRTERRGALNCTATCRGPQNMPLTNRPFRVSNAWWTIADQVFRAGPEQMSAYRENPG